MLKRIALTGCAIVCLSLAAPRQSEACLFSWLFGCHSCFRPTTASYCPSPCSTTACSPCSTGGCSPCGVSGSCATGDCNVNTYSIPQSDDITSRQSLRYGVPAGMIGQPYGPAPVIIHPAPQPSVPETTPLTLPETGEPVAVRQRVSPNPTVRPASISRAATDSSSVNAGWIPVGP